MPLQFPTKPANIKNEFKGIYNGNVCIIKFFKQRKELGNNLR